MKVNKFFPAEIKYSLPIIKESKEDILEALKIKGYDFYEIWLDYIKDLDEQFILGLAKKYEEKLIFLFRRKNLEKIEMPLEKRIAIISFLAKYSIFFDFDFLSQKEELKFLKVSSKHKMILSYHNYRKTPTSGFLQSLIKKMKKFEPAIFKIATFCKSENDALRLLDLQLKLRDQGRKYLILGMGEKGLITRIFGTLYGNEITPAPNNIKEKSATGQLSKQQLEEIFTAVCGGAGKIN